MAALGDIATIAHVLKRAYALYDGCRSAPEEIFLAREHIHAMALCLEGVSSDLYTNPRSFVHQTTCAAKVRQHALKVHIASCDRSLHRMESLLKKYQGFKGKHVSLWDKFRWSTQGKKEIAESKADLVVSTVTLDMFLSKESLNVLWKLESMIEALTARISMFETLLAQTAPAHTTGRATLAPGRPRGRRDSNVGRTLVVSLVLARLRKVLLSYRRKKKNARPGQGRPRPLTRTPSGFKASPARTALMHTYASNLITTPPPTYFPHPRPPSPDFPVLPTTFPRPIRRSSSLQNIQHPPTSKGEQPKDLYACYRIGIGTLAFGGKTAPQFLRHRRGQAQLAKMAQIFSEAAGYDSKGLTEGDKRVKLLLRDMNKIEGKKGGRRKWYFAAGRVVGVDGGRTGMVCVEKAVVVVVRR
ncbi:hypothetical protein BU23DRAFT_570088 [Bimuria novae-zelandiae CBS 107.79]|uniref:Fungal N-terminal domain-containing protein n=1 Tax=Bimuria novae-zelandiae CBS 107.79 TaxID=1447943 RepID=A0A6A5V2I6_9PLEO|nr:hypothetical protein BU23DRAFT_570088 [Bimuria novae-zelandiae CBS 107.79]